MIYINIYFYLYIYIYILVYDAAAAVPPRLLSR